MKIKQQQQSNQNEWLTETDGDNEMMIKVVYKSTLSRWTIILTRWVKSYNILLSETITTQSCNVGESV